MLTARNGNGREVGGQGDWRCSASELNWHWRGSRWKGTEPWGWSCKVNCQGVGLGSSDVLFTIRDPCIACTQKKSEVAEKFLVLERNGEGRREPGAPGVGGGVGGRVGAQVRGWWGWCVVGPGLRGLPPSSWGLWSLVIRGCLMVIGSETVGWEASWGPGGLDCGFISISQERLSQTQTPRLHCRPFEQVCLWPVTFKLPQVTLVFSSA